MKPIVAVVGRPNVGKSTLFNKLAGRRVSIVKDTPGVTRDRIYADASWLDKDYLVVDTGGIEPDTSDILLQSMRSQAQLAIDTADVIIFVTDAKSGMTDADVEVANMLRKSHKPVVVAVNKLDNMLDITAMYEFYSLGLGDPMPISAEQGQGIGDLLDEVVKYFPEKAEGEEESELLKLAVIGKPNVGKSSLINKLLGEDRVIVSDIAGTTRDSIDAVVTNRGRQYLFIDTAGIRRQSRVNEDIERVSVIRAVASVERCDIAIVMIDAETGVTEQDAKIAGLAHEKGKGLVLAVNKWDAIEKDDKTIYKFSRQLDETLSFIPYAEKVFISAKTGLRIDKLFDSIQQTEESQNKRVPTGVLNDVLYEAMSLNQPPSDKGRRLKIYYMTQIGVKPPTFVIFVNDKKLMHYSYTRYIENQIRENFGFSGTPLQFIIRERGVLEERF
ncbi:MAG: ribosome biogenesis GTPase Der [Firmicutes bacterium]|nr:ribosome biogenesis GTPase Der [Bacillota bacterium]MBQ5960084.1 ribosome biogenesis GTPase Der [Bacillota bacterium]